MHHERSEVDRRSVRVRLSPKGTELRDSVAALFRRHADGIEAKSVLGLADLGGVNANLRRLERFWSDQIRYIY
jgi:DNA-binding MarR family transcriptional regulator